MFDVNEILAMLQNGENPDTIAQKALDAVNEAQRIQKEEEEEAKRIEAEKAIAAKIAADKKRAMDDALYEVINATIDYLGLIDADIADAVCNMTNGLTEDELDDIHQSIGAMAEMTVALQKLDDILGNSSSKKLLGGTFANSLHADKIDKMLNMAPDTGSKKIVSDDDVIANFIKMLG